MNESIGKRVLILLHCALIPSILFVLGLCAVILPKPVFSEYERRDLETFPEFTTASLRSGAFTAQIDRFYADTFPLRESFVQLNASLAEKRGIQYNDMILYETGNGTLGDNGPSTTPIQSSVPPSASLQPPQSSQPVAPEGPAGPPAPVTDDSPDGDETGSSSAPASSGQSSQGESSQSQSSAPPPSSSASSSQTPPAADGGTGADINAPAPETYNSILIYQNMAMAPFGGTKTASEYYASVLNNYHEVLGDSVKIYNLIVPTSIEFYLPDQYKSVTNPQKPNIDYIYSLLSPEISKVDAYSAIQQHTDEYLYFATDHHWTALGAYYAYTAFAKEAGFEPKPLDSMEKRTISPFIGTMYNQTQSSKLLENPDYVDYYITDTQHQAYQFPRNSPYHGNPVSVWAEFAKGGNAYSVFLYGDQPLTRIDTEHKNGRKIMVVKESFGNAFAPYLIPHYEQVFVVDQRYFQINGLKFIQDNGINEILFINNIFAANTSSQIRCIERILTQSDWYFETRPASSSSESSSQESPEGEGNEAEKTEKQKEDEKDNSSGTGSSSQKVTVKKRE